MSRLKSVVFGILITAAQSAGAVDRPLFETFAICTGRLSAEMEHAWLMGDSDADLFRDLRSEFASLLSATQPEGAGRQVLGIRVDAKMSHAQLLTQGQFGTDARSRQFAINRAAAGRSVCTKMLLKS